MPDRREALRIIEAILFASAEPLDEAMLALRLPDRTDLPVLLADLADTYSGRGVNLVAVEGKWAFRTAPDLAAHLGTQAVVARKLSRAAMETLAIIAYHQPVTRAEIEEIRGVALSKGTLDVLLEAGWVRPKGRRQAPGRPVMWATSDRFLDQFGLDCVDDLPGIEELKQAGLLTRGPAIALRESERDLVDLAEDAEAAELAADLERDDGDPDHDHADPSGRGGGPR